MLLHESTQLFCFFMRIHKGMTALNGSLVHLSNHLRRGTRVTNSCWRGTQRHRLSDQIHVQSNGNHKIAGRWLPHTWVVTCQKETRAPVVVNRPRVIFPQNISEFRPASLNYF